MAPTDFSSLKKNRTKSLDKLNAQLIERLGMIPRVNVG